MSKDTIEIISAIGVLILGVVSLLMAILTFKNNNRLSKQENVMDLHSAWRDVNEIDPDNLIVQDIVNAVNALTITSTLWNHDILEKTIIYQSYWKSFEQLFDMLNSISEKVPGQEERCCDKMTDDIKKAYRDMKDSKWEQLSRKMFS